MTVGDLVGHRVRLYCQATKENLGGWIIGNSLDSLEVKLSSKKTPEKGHRWLAVIMHKQGEVTLPVRVIATANRQALIGVVGFAQIQPNARDPRHFHWRVHDIELNGATLPVMVADISIGGIGVVSEHEFRVGQTISCIVHVRGADMKIQGTVKYVAELDDDSAGLYRVGIEICNMSRSDRARWQVFINKDEPIVETASLLSVEERRRGKKSSVRIVKLAA